MRIELLDPHRHQRESFSCGEPSLDRYLGSQAAQDARRNLSTTFCLVEPDRPEVILGYFSMSPGGVILEAVPAQLRRRLPRYDQIPIMRVGRLAVARQRQGSGVGQMLLLEALRVALENPLRAWAVVVDALPQARDFYIKFGFQPFPDASDQLFITMSDVRATFVASGK